MRGYPAVQTSRLRCSSGRPCDSVICNMASPESPKLPLRVANHALAATRGAIHDAFEVGSPCSMFSLAELQSDAQDPGVR